MWNAQAPLRIAAAKFTPVVVPAGALGADTGALDELRAEGADASLVIARGPEVEATEAD